MRYKGDPMPVPSPVRAKARKPSKKDARQRRRARQATLQRVAIALAGVLAVGLVTYFVWDFLRPKLGQVYPQQARTHIQVGDPHEPYNSDPPTSGPHAAPVAAGFYDTAPPDENLVHNLEHGYVVLWYNCDTLDEAGCTDLKTKIQGVIDRARPVIITTGAKKLVAVPRPGLDGLIALTSWGRLLTLSTFDETQITAFINDFRNEAPEAAVP
jgi:hypothetical protein